MTLVDAAQTQRALSPLVGKPLTAARRQGSMLALTFGELREVSFNLPRKGPTTIIEGDFMLDVQCAWHLTHLERGIVVGADDQYVPAGQPETIPDDWHYDGPLGNHLDEQIKAWRSALPLIVRAVDVDAFGGFVLMLSDGYTLRVFPSHHHGAEYWRLFTSDLESRHFVVTGQGIEA